MKMPDKVPHTYFIKRDFAALKISDLSLSKYAGLVTRSIPDYLWLLTITKS